MKSYKVLFVLFAVLLSVQGLFSQNSEVNLDDAKYCMEEGIYSPDMQIRKQSFYTLLKQNKTEALPAIIEQFTAEKEESVRLVIARVIHLFGTVDGIKALEQVAWSDDNIKVRHLCRSLCVDYAAKNPDQYSLDIQRLDRVLADATQ